MVQSVESLKDRAIESRDIGQVEAATLHRLGVKRPFALMAAAAEIREHFKGNKVNLCGIVNAKSGLCAENCKFCAQSAHHQTDAPVYPLLKKAEMVDRARRMKEESAHMFGIITSGTRIESEQEWEEIYGTVKEIKKLGITPCVSLGMIDRSRAKDLKKAGLFRYHHNLETARSFFDRILYHPRVRGGHRYGPGSKRSGPFHVFRRDHRHGRDHGTTDRTGAYPEGAGRGLRAGEHPQSEAGYAAPAPNTAISHRDPLHDRDFPLHPPGQGHQAMRGEGGEPEAVATPGDRGRLQLVDDGRLPDHRGEES